MRNPSEKSFTLVVLLRPSRQVLVVFLDEGNKKRDVRLMVSELLPGRAKTFPQARLDVHPVVKAKVTEEVNYQFARRISHVATTGQLHLQAMKHLG